MESASISPVFSFVLPAHNEVMNVPVMTERLVSVGKELGEPFEVVWVDDGSTDGTGTVLDELAASDDHVRVLHLSRNFGHMAALTAGLECARGTGAVVCMDADGQHPPELIPEMVEKWRNGAEIVQTVKKRMAGETPVQGLCKRLFCLFLKHFGELDLPAGAADFRLLDREALDAVNALPEHVRFVRGLVYWVGYRRELIHFEAPRRMAGETKYSFWKLTSMALSGITSFSTRPLRLSFLLGTVVTGFGALYAAYVLWCYATGVDLPHGWPSTLLVVLILGGIQLMAVGILSEYMARLYTETKGRPVYLLRKASSPDRTGDDSK